LPFIFIFMTPLPWGQVNIGRPFFSLTLLRGWFEECSSPFTTETRKPSKNQMIRFAVLISCLLFDIRNNENVETSWKKK
jgi:hypothetical protein